MPTTVNHFTSPGSAGTSCGTFLPESPSSVVERPLRLLIVEDVTSLKLMQRRGHEVCSASNVARALELAASQTFDLVISGAAGGHGLELMKEIKDLYLWPGVALSGFGKDADLQASSDAEFALYLVKPVAAGDLSRAIASVQVLAG